MSSVFLNLTDSNYTSKNSAALHNATQANNVGEALRLTSCRMEVLFRGGGGAEAKQHVMDVRF